MSWVMRNNKINNSNAADVVIILGGGIGGSGKLLSSTRRRLDFFLGMKQKFVSTPIILSGWCTGFMKEKPLITEAEAMRAILARRGIDSKYIYLEKQSLDTISNAVFSKQLVGKNRGWKRIVLITSDYHMQRALWIFRRIFGNSYRFIPFPAPSGGLIQKKRKDYELYLLDIAKKFLANTPTDSHELIKLLRKKHPFYSRSKEAKILLKEIGGRKRKISA